MVTELLQQVGLNKYEAEAYTALLLHGPLTGYELGKRSGVPLSRSYEILERLSGKGLALVQPGDPPRYTAQEPAQFLARVRTETTTTLDALTRELAAIAQPQPAEGFWVLRGREHVLARANAMIGAAQQRVALRLPASELPALADALAQARARGCRVMQVAGEESATVQLLADGREALVGTLAPTDRCQAVVSSNPALLEAIERSFPARPALTVAQAATPPAPTAPALDWLDWEQRKHGQLLAAPRNNSAA